jgi:Xaa-Pro aminopeptidase
VGVLKPAENYMAALDMFANPSRQHLIDRLKSAKKTIELIDIRSHVTALRMIKSNYEIQTIKQASNHTQRIFDIIERKRLKAANENDLMAEVTDYVIRQQLTFAYEPIIASGINAVTLHYVKNNAPIDKKSLLLLDIGLKYKGYCADITRTVSYSPTNRQQEVYDAVLAVRQQAISLLKPGIKLKTYEKKVNELMGKKLHELG